MKLVGAGGQQRRDYLWRADAVMTGSSQLVLGYSQARSHLLLFNTGASAISIEIGSGAAHCALTGALGGVASVTVDNAGMGFSKPPLVRFLGGNSPLSDTPLWSYTGSSQPGTPSPNHPATAHCVMTGSAPNMSISSIVVDDPGVGYGVPPYVLIENDPMDPNGCALAVTNGGIILPASMGSPIVWNGTACPTEPVSAIGTAAVNLICRWMD